MLTQIDPLQSDKKHVLDPPKTQTKIREVKCEVKKVGEYTFWMRSKRVIFALKKWIFDPFRGVSVRSKREVSIHVSIHLKVGFVRQKLIKNVRTDLKK